MRNPDYIEISITFRGIDGTEATTTAELWPNSEMPDYYDTMRTCALIHFVENDAQKRVLSKAFGYLGRNGLSRNPLSVHLFWGGPDEPPEGFKDCHPLPDGSQVLVVETGDGRWEIVDEQEE